MHFLFPLQKILYLLPTTIIFSLSDFPHPPLHDGVYLSSLPLSFLSESVLIHVALQPQFLDAPNPELNSLPVFPQSLSYLSFRHPLFIELPAENYQGLICHVHILHGLSDIYGNNASGEKFEM